MKYFLITLFVLTRLDLSAQTDYLNDNVIYKTIYPKDLKGFLGSHPETILIDVRSPGEYSDTSMYGSLNIGRLNNAINIPIDSIGKRLEALKNDSNKTIVLYCSHSQRSRRVSKKLGENGFKKVYNLNGGMTWMSQADEKEFPGKNELIVCSLPFKNISAEECYSLINGRKDLVVIDVRSVMEFEGKDSIEANNVGRIKMAVNVPAYKGKIDLNKVKAFKGKPVLIYDLNGALSNHVGRFLTENGFDDVYHLAGGLSSLIGLEKETTAMRREILENTPSYSILNVKESIDFITNVKGGLVIDVRTPDEFDNTAKERWRKLGRIRNSVNIPYKEFEQQLPELIKDKNMRLFVYGSHDAQKFCRRLKEAGFEDVNCMSGGLWVMIYTYANVPGYKVISEIIENHDGIF